MSMEYLPDMIRRCTSHNGNSGAVSFLNNSRNVCYSINGVRSNVLSNGSDLHQTLTTGRIMLQKIDVADHTDQLSFVRNRHGTKLVERQKVGHLMKRRVG